MPSTVSDRIKVLLLTQPTTGGAGLQVWQLATMIDGERFRVTVGSPQTGWLRSRLLAQGVDHRRIEFVRQVRPVHDLWSFLAILRLIRKERPEIIHAHSSKAGILGRAAGALCRVPAIVYTPHGFAFNQANGWSKRLYLWLERAFARFADRIICVSDSERAGALENHVARSEKLVVIRNGVEIPSDTHPSGGTLRGMLGVGPATRIVAMVSRLRRPKLPEDLLHAAAIVAGRSDRGDVCFVFIGGGPLEESTRDLARRLGLEDHVVFLGERQDVPDLMPDIDVVILASAAEGMPYSILEAMAAGKPVIGSMVPGLADLILEGETGFSYTPGDPAELAGVLLPLLDDQGLRRRLGEEGRRMVVGNFTADRMVREAQDLYAALLGGKIGSSAVNKPAWH